MRTNELCRFSCCQRHTYILKYYFLDFSRRVWFAIKEVENFFAGYIRVFIFSFTFKNTLLCATTASLEEWKQFSRRTTFHCVAKNTERPAHVLEIQNTTYSRQEIKLQWNFPSKLLYIKSNLVAKNLIKKNLIFLQHSILSLHHNSVILISEVLISISYILFRMSRIISRSTTAKCV